MKKKLVSAIYFTYKRAILLDASLDSIYKNFKNLDTKINIIYHFNEEHEQSYKYLFKKYSNKNIKVIKRLKSNFLKQDILFLLRPLNLLWLLRWKKIYHDFNNFKYLLENILKSVDTDFVMFVPDDQIFYKKTYIPDKVFDLILKNKYQTYYRFFTGDHFVGKYSLPRKMNVEQFTDQGIDFFKWSNKDPHAKYLWNYRFTIEGTVFHKDALIKLLKPMLYHNPITLEAIGLWESRFRNFFEYGLSSNSRTAATFQINNVQNLVKNQCSFFDPDILMEKYLSGFTLDYSLNDFDLSKLDVVPNKLFLKKNGSKIECITNKI
jgi:hypothetical protein